MDLSGHEGEIPMPITSTYVAAAAAAAAGHGHHHPHGVLLDSPSSLHHNNHHLSNGPPPPPPPPPPPALSTVTTEDHHHNHHHSYNPKKVVRYRECLKNHAASIGCNATDGCGEFMPSGEEGTLEALKCSACNCHRNFHRKEIEGDSSYSSDCYPYPSYKGGGARKIMSQKGQGLLISSGSADPYGYGPLGNNLITRAHPHHMIMPLGVLQQTSESDEMEGVGGGGGGVMVRPAIVKKRFRTKFTPEQKEKMLSFAEKVEWRLQKQEESVIQQFCQEIGVKRRVLKVWMHNNKLNLAKKNSLSSSSLNEN